MEAPLVTALQNPIGPRITDDLPGIGGEIKVEPAHFVVEEIPLYEPCGEGQHVYVRLQREGWTTRALLGRLQQLFELEEVDVSCAGLKDKQALATQTFSLLLRELDEESIARRIQEHLPVDVLWVRRHRNKLRQGHLLGNRFRITVLDTQEQALPLAQRIERALQERGLPNYYGPQRFGLGGDNALQGLQVLQGKGPKVRWKRRFMLYALQAALFNLWLAERIRRNWFGQLLKGDIAKKTDTGGLFEVEDLEAEVPRFRRGEITYTGPIYGHKMRWPEGEPGAIERAILEASEIQPAQLKRARLDGSRRPGRLLLDDLQIERAADGLRFSFSLPKGSYATTVLREFMKVESDLPEE
ncbi:MAG: tRNA pseudouridine(13) synthase TruD [Chloroflexia bacterium]|nr:tRNA pseudouridine(13) synthase TruD [Chloroflexia bacterium]